MVAARVIATMDGGDNDSRTAVFDRCLERRQGARPLSRSANMLVTLFTWRGASTGGAPISALRVREPVGELHARIASLRRDERD